MAWAGLAYALAIFGGIAALFYHANRRSGPRWKVAGYSVLFVLLLLTVGMLRMGGSDDCGTGLPARYQDC